MTKTSQMSQKITPGAVAILLTAFYLIGWDLGVTLIALIMWVIVCLMVLVAISTLLVSRGFPPEKRVVRTPSPSNTSKPLFMFQWLCIGVACSVLWVANWPVLAIAYPAASCFVLIMSRIVRNHVFKEA